MSNDDGRVLYPRIVLTRSFAHYMAERYNEYTTWLLDTYGHEVHQYGIDLLNVNRDDVTVIQEQYHYFLQHQTTTQA